MKTIKNKETGGFFRITNELAEELVIKNIAVYCYSTKKGYKKQEKQKTKVRAKKKSIFRAKEEKEHQERLLTWKLTYKVDEDGKKTPVPLRPKISPQRNDQLQKQKRNRKGKKANK